MAGSPKPCLTLSEMAATLGVSRQTIWQRASREDWPYFEETARGGRRRLYPVEHLPLAVALALFREESAKAAAKCLPVAMPAPDCEPESLWKWASTRTQKQRGVGRFRAEVIARVEELAKEHGLSLVEAARRVAGEMGVSVASIRNWYYGAGGRPGARLYAPQDRAAALIPFFGGRRRRFEIPKQAWAFFVALYLDRGQPTIADCYRRTREAAGLYGWGELPSPRTFGKRVKTDIPPELRVVARAGMRDAVARSEITRRGGGREAAK